MVYSLHQDFSGTFSTLRIITVYPVTQTKHPLLRFLHWLDVYGHCSWSLKQTYQSCCLSEQCCASQNSILLILILLISMAPCELTNWHKSCHRKSSKLLLNLFMLIITYRLVCLLGMPSWHTLTVMSNNVFPGRTTKKKSFFSLLYLLYM